MKTQVVRVGKHTHQMLRQLSRQRRESMRSIAEAAVEEYRRKQFFELADAAYAKLRASEPEWQEYVAERRALDATLMDGIE